jgi:hypothetical protein
MPPDQGKERRLILLFLLSPLIYPWEEENEKE